MQSAWAVLSSVASPALRCISKLSNKKKVLTWNVYFDFLYNFCPDIFSILRINERDITIYYQTLPYITKYYHILPDITIYYQTLPFITIYYQTLPYITIYYQTLPYITRYYQILPCITICYQTLPYITRHCHILPDITIYYQTLTYITKHCHILPYITRYYQILPYIIRCHILPAITIYYQTLPYITIYYQILPDITIYYHILPDITIYYQILPYITIYAHRYSRKVPVFCQILIKPLIFSKYFRKKHSTIKLHKQLSNGSRLVPFAQTDRQIDRYDGANNRFSQFCELV
jgi:hypothetical protein